MTFAVWSHSMIIHHTFSFCLHYFKFSFVRQLRCAKSSLGWEKKKSIQVQNILTFNFWGTRCISPCYPVHQPSCMSKGYSCIMEGLGLWKLACRNISWHLYPLDHKTDVLSKDKIVVMIVLYGSAEKDTKADQVRIKSTCNNFGTKKIQSYIVYHISEPVI